MSAWSEYKKKLGSTRPWDILDPAKHHDDPEVVKARYLTCLSCPELIQSTKQCKECGCIMPIKVKLREAVCPIGKW
jgi:hypothetical protein